MHYLERVEIDLPSIILNNSDIFFDSIKVCPSVCRCIFILNLQITIFGHILMKFNTLVHFR